MQYIVTFFNPITFLQEESCISLVIPPFFYVKLLDLCSTVCIIVAGNEYDSAFITSSTIILIFFHKYKKKPHFWVHYEQ